MSHTLDLVLAGGRVFDGLGGPGRVLDVGVAGSRIAVLAPAGTLRGTRTIPCKNLCVAPGFIDTHAHTDLRVLVDPTLPSQTRQGVTSEVLGLDGLSVAPIAESDIDERKERVAAVLGAPGAAWSWRSVSEYLDVLAAARPSVDLAYLVPHGALRQSILGMQDRPPTADELARMVAAVQEGLAAGAIGLSTGLAAPPCCYATADELVALCGPVAKAGGTFVVHLRSESANLLPAVDEALDVARRSGVRLHVSHLKVAGIQNYALVEDLVDRLEAARAAGLPVTADQYPYASSSTTLAAILPPWMHAGGVAETLARLGSTELRERLRHEMSSPAPVTWDNYWKWSGPEGIVISDIQSGRQPELVGRSLAESAARAGVEVLELTLELLVRERLGVSMVTQSQSEAIVARLLTLPWINICTDGRFGGRPHPRLYGTYPRIFARYVRDQGLLSWQEAIRKMTSQGADALGLGPVGRIAQGFWANLVVFDPERVKDAATIAEPGRFPLGIRHVLTRGVAVVRDETGTGLPGPGVVQRGLHV
jgi:N-acyl-D-amino-acid deacylase